MLRHVVLLRLDDRVDDRTVERIAEALRALPGSVPDIRDFHVGIDMGLADGNAQLSVIALFDDEAGYLRYRDHPDHLSAIETHVRPVLVDRSATQHWTPPPDPTFS